MIEVTGVNKMFGEIKALDNIVATIQEGSIFGLIGTNGAGKSTLLRVISGVLKPDTGMALIDGENVYENPQAKAKIFFLPDNAYFFQNATAKTMAEYYQVIYPQFDMERFREMVSGFGLEFTRKLSTFSKGMKRQVALLLGVCAGTKYLICDESFDGLDPVVRQAVKSIFASEIMKRDFTPIIASHNLRELEDICDHVGLLYKGGILLSKDLDDMKLNIHKIQCVLKPGIKVEDLTELDILKTEYRGSLATITVRGSRENVERQMAACEPLFFELIPLSLEEIFISETEVAGYDIKKLIF